MEENKHNKTKGKDAYETERESDTDPQEKMRGPVSSFIQKIKEAAEDNDDKEQAKHEQKKNASGGDFINE